LRKTARTRVERIEKYDGAHIKIHLDAAAINIMRPEPKQKNETAKRSDAAQRKLETEV
jgi:hypothetical protein